MKNTHRRRFLKTSLAAGLMGGSGLTVEALASSGPRRGGHFKLGLGHGSAADSLDPGTWENQFTNSLAHAIHGRMVEIAADGALVGDVMSEWSHSNGATNWRFRLRDGVTFHDGTPVRTADVTASLAYHMGEGNQSAASPLLADVIDLARDETSVTFTLSAGNADFPYRLTDGHLVIVPSNDGAIDPLNGIGCGPYRLKRFDPGVIAELTRYDGYWDDARGHFDSAAILTILDPAARQNALLTGEIHAIDRVPLETVDLVRGNPALQIIEVTGTQHYTLPMLCDTAPYTDPNLRKAVKFAIDRQELLEKILHGHGAIGNDSPIAPANRFYHAEMAQTSYDPDKARYHLKQAGHDTLSLTLSVADAAFPGAVNAAQLIRNTAAPVGLDIQVEKVPSDGYWANIWRSRPWCASYWGGRTTEDAMFSEVYQSGVPWNESRWSNARFDELLLNARAETDDALRQEMYFEMQELVRDDGGSVIPLFANFVFARRAEVSTPKAIGANWTLDGGRCIERWWFT